MDQHDRFIASRHREIARRYENHWRERGKPRHNTIRLAEIRRLLRHRHLHYEKLSNSDLDKIIFDLVGGAELGSLSADVLGNKLELTFQEREFLDIRTIRAFDKSCAETQAFYREKKRKRDRIGARRRRAAARQFRKPSPRKRDLQISKVRDVLTRQPTDFWSTVDELTNALAKTRGFRGLKFQTLRRAMHRILDRMKGEIEEDRAYRKGCLQVRLVRLKQGIP